jgi:hypothetical protein
VAIIAAPQVATHGEPSGALAFCAAQTAKVPGAIAANINPVTSRRTSLQRRSKRFEKPNQSTQSLKSLSSEIYQHYCC